MKPNKFLSVAAITAMLLTGCSSASNDTDTADDAITYTEGVTVAPNEDTSSDAHYSVTFVYKDTDDRDAVSITVGGNMQWYSYDDDVVDSFYDTGSTEGAKVYRVEDYTADLFNTGYNVESWSVEKYNMEEVEDETFVVTLNLPGNEYYYDYTVTYDVEQLKQSRTQ